MDFTMNSRKFRLLDALQNAAKPEEGQTPFKSVRDRLVCKQIRKQQRLKVDTSSVEFANEMKLRLLENWEITKRKAIEKLVIEVDHLQDIEKKIHAREMALQQRGIDVNDVLEKRRVKTMPLMPKTRNSISATSTPLAKRPRLMPNIKTFAEPNENEVIIGPNGTRIEKSALNSINWSLSGAAITRKILMEVFDRKTLSSHTLTGKPSPAFMDCDKPMKNQLDPAKVADIIHIVTQNLNMTPKEVRNAITTKCADENKMLRQREKKRLSMPKKQSEANKENM